MNAHWTLSLFTHAWRSCAAGLSVCLGLAAPLTASAQVPLSLPGGHHDVRVERVTAPAAQPIWLPTESPQFVNIPKMSATFVAAQDSTNLAVTFSAEAQTDLAGKRMMVRALVDGTVAAPADVVFTDGPFGGARTFVFTQVVDRGLHTVEIQWMVDAGASASMRAASLLLQHGRSTGDGTLTLATTSRVDNLPGAFWKAVPGAETGFFVPAGGSTVVGFSAETWVTNGKRLFMRALVDGVPAKPSDVVFARRSSRQSHYMTFGTDTLAPGWHTVRIESLVDAGGTTTIGDRTIVVSSRSQHATRRHIAVVPPSGPSISTSSSSWTQVPGLSAVVPVPKNGEFVVTFSGEVSSGTSSTLEMRLVVDGVPSLETAVMATSALPFEAQSFTFDRKHVFSTASLVGVALQWRALGGTVWMADRSMALLAEPGLVPDLAEAPEIGRGTASYPNGAPVEAAIGKRPVLTIIHRIDRDAPDDVMPTAAQVADALYGPGGTHEYYTTASGGRFGLANAGVIEVDALKAESHYWMHGPFDCGAPLEDGFAGGHAERWAEAIALADEAVDFSAYDRDGDGVLRPDELGILIVVPQQKTDGFTRALDPFCDGSPVVADGVVLPEMSEWFTSAPSVNHEVATHELAHQLLNLGDMYVNGLNFDTEAGTLSLMGDNFGTTAHIDAVNKLALGWVTPLVPVSDTTYALDDVRTSGTVAVLPRALDGDGREFFALENRSPDIGDGLFDTGTGLRGIVAWHSVESPVQNAAPPACVAPATWAGVSGALRRGVRVIRPGVVFATGASSSWNAGDPDLLDDGVVCPGGGVATNSLRWADGSASGFDLKTFSVNGPTMTVDVNVP